MKKRLLAAAIACAALLNSAHAAPIVYNWQGTATTSLSQFGIQVGDAYSGSVTFNADNARMYNADIYDNSGYAWWTSTPMSVTVKAGTLQQSIDVETMVANNYYSNYDIQFYNGTSPLGYFNLQLTDTIGTAVNDFALPTAALDFKAFNIHRLHMFGEVVADITSFSATPPAAVPEPATTRLLALGVAAVCLARRRKQRA